MLPLFLVKGREQLDFGDRGVHWVAVYHQKIAGQWRQLPICHHVFAVELEGFFEIFINGNAERGTGLERSQEGFLKIRRRDITAQPEHQVAGVIFQFLVAAVLFYLLHRQHFVEVVVNFQHKKGVLKVEKRALRGLRWPHFGQLTEKRLFLFGQVFGQNEVDFGKKVAEFSRAAIFRHAQRF